MAENAEIAPGRVAVLESEWEALVAFHQRTMATMRALFGEDAEGFKRVMKLLEGTPDVGASTDLQRVMDLTIAERDAARSAARRMEEHGEHYAAAMVRGLA